MKVGKGVFVYLGLLAYSVCAGQNVADSIVNVPYSIGRANTELLKDNNSVMIQDALIGTMPGVRVVQSSGDPNSNPHVIIRGFTSYYNSNDPLYVLDGVIIDAPNLLNNPNTMGFLNPDDIASITVLKDAAATSVYGSRGLNGVILLTSKKGTKDIKVNYSGNFSISTARLVDVLTGDELRDIWDKIQGSTSEKAGYRYPGKDNCNYQDLIYQAAFGTKNTVSVSGNISPIHTPFRVSLGIVNQNGVIKTNLYQRYNALVSLSPSLLQDHLKINANFRASHEKSQHVDETVVNSAIFTDPTIDNSDGNIIWDIGIAPLAFQSPNPVSQIRDEYLKNKTNRYNGNIALNYKAHDFEALSFNVNGAFDIMRNNYEGGIDAESQYSFSQNLMLSSFRREYSCDRNNYYLDGNIAYNNTFKYGNTIGIQIGYYFQQINRSEKYDFEGYNSDWFNKNNYGTNRYDYPEYDYSYSNFYSRVNYNYKEKYFITAAVGREKKVNPSPRNENQEITYKVYPSVGVAWNVSKERFLKNVSIINNLTVRGSYSVNSENNYYPKVIRALECVNAEVESFTIGSDFSLMNNRLTGSLEYYNRNIKNGVYLQEYKYGDPNIPDTKSPTNMDFKNEGVEFSINGLLIKNKELTWNIGANLTWQSSKVLKRHTEFTKIVCEKLDDYNNYTLFEKNQTPGTYYIYPSKFNENGEEIVVESDNEIYPISTDKSSLPSVYFGLNTNLVYKNWDFSFNGHGAFGGYLYNVVDAKGLRGALGVNEIRNLTQNIVDKGWKYMRYIDSDEFLQNASFFKIDNITFGYTFKNLWSGNSSLRASFNAHNIATITSYKGIDPEIISAYDNAGYRIPRSYSISLNLNF